MELSISTTIFQTSEKTLCSFEKGLKMCADAGFEWIELSRKHSDLTRKKDFIESLGLKVWSVHGTIGGGATSASESERRETVEIELARMEDSAVFAPCPYVIHYLNRANDPAIGVAFRKSIEDLVEKAVELGLNLAIETVPHKSSNERYPDSMEVAEFARSFDSPNVSVCVDLNHSNLNEDLIQVCSNCSGLISNIHVSDNHGEYEDHLPPGEGVIEFPPVFLALRKNGYAGPCNIECHVPDEISTELLKNIHAESARLVEKVD
jgi:sugar phosphate isomerase/epimerase